MLLHPVDWAVIAVYLIGCVIAGVWMKRFVRGVEDFAIAGRQMDINLGVASLAATEVGIVTIMYTAQMGFEHGFAGATPGLLIAAAMFIVGWTGFVIGPLREAGVMTIPELFEKRFGKSVRWLAGLVVILGGLLNMGIFLRLGGEFLVHVTGMPPEYLEWTMTALLLIVLLYTVLGGMLSVLVTDYLQFLVMGLGIVITSILVLSDIGWSNLVEILEKAHRQRMQATPVASGPQRIESPPFNRRDIPNGSIYYALTESPPFNRRDMLGVDSFHTPNDFPRSMETQKAEWPLQEKSLTPGSFPGFPGSGSGTVQFVAVTASGLCLKAPSGQKLPADQSPSLTGPHGSSDPPTDVATSSETRIEQSTLPSAPLTIGNPFNPVGRGGLGWRWVVWQAILAIAIVTTWQTTITRVLSAKSPRTARTIYRRTAFYFVGRFALPGLWGAAAFAFYYQKGGLPPGIEGMAAMPSYLHQVLPAGLVGIVIAAMLAAEMSTDSGYLVTWATVIYNDLLMPCLRRPPSPTLRLLIIRSLVLAIGVFLLVYGLWYELPGTAWDYLAVTGNIYLASVFTLLVAGLYWRHATRFGALTALTLGAIGPLAFVIINASVPKNSAWQIAPEIAGLSSFVFAGGGMLLGSFAENFWQRFRKAPIPPNDSS